MDGSAGSFGSGSAGTGGGGGAADGGPIERETSLLFKLLPYASAYEARVGRLTDAEMSQAAAEFAAQGFVVTAGWSDVPVALGQLVILGFRPSGSSATYEARVEQIATTPGSADPKLVELGAAGFLATAVTAYGRALWGFKLSGVTTAYETRTDLVSETALATLARTYGAEGFAMVSAQSPSAAVAITVGFKPSGSAASYEARVDVIERALQVNPTELGMRAQEYGSAGFVITSVNKTEFRRNGTDFIAHRVTSFKVSGSSARYEARVDDAADDQLDAKVAEYAAAGFIVTAVTPRATTEPAGFRLWGIRRPRPN